MPDPQPERLTLSRLATPLGEAVMVTDEDGALRAFDWSGLDARLGTLMRRAYGEATPLEEAEAPPPIALALAAYFDGELGALGDIPCRARGTAFQQRAWEALRRIPAGTTVSYGEQARRMAAPKAVRAVGLANGANPIGLVVPCHRVIGADRTLTGYGAGLERKAWLLRHEGAM